MYEENRRFDWAGLFIKLIIVVIFILFTVWLLSLSNKGMSTSLSVLTDNVFSGNIEKMKEVGKSYFTTERLPQKVGEVSTLTLDRMYDKKLILPLKDKNGKSCSAEKSYVSIQKMENEYQMKVYLDCPEKTDYVVVIMGCYKYCDADICEKKDLDSLEYEYKKTANGYWTNWSGWSNWSKTKVTKTDSRDVETKVVKEDYTYEKDVTETKVVGNATCASISGYALVSNKNGVCTYSKTTSASTNPTCPTVSGYTLTKRDGFNCSYKSDKADYKSPVCPTVDGYEYVGRDGTTCNYEFEDTITKNPTCPSVTGYTVTGRSGFTCSYTKNNSSTVNPTCPSVTGYDLTSRSGFTCNYSKSTTVTADPKCPDMDGYALNDRSGFTCNYSTSYQVPVGKRIVSSCDGCAKEVQTVYETRYIYKTGNAECPNGYSQSGDICVSTNTSRIVREAACPNGYIVSGNTCVVSNLNITRTAKCPSGYTRSGNVCEYTETETTTRTAKCPSGYTKSGKGSSCEKYATTTKEAACPSGYVKSGNTCSKTTTDTITRSAVCKDKQTMKSGKCYGKVTTKKTVTEKIDVTYYRFRTRKYISGASDYKWSASNTDKSLLNSGYKLTGKTREVTL